MSLPVNVEDELQHFQLIASRLEGSVCDLVSSSALSGGPSTTPLERAQASLALAQLIQALHFLLVKGQGEDLRAAGVLSEQERLKSYQVKVNKATAADELKKSRPTATLDVAGANRFINHAIPDLTPEQRDLLKQATNNLNQSSGPRTRGGAKRGAAAAEGQGRANPQGGRASKAAKVANAKEAAVEFLQQLRAEASKPQ